MADDASAGGAHLGEGRILGASGILGVNNLQRAIDTFDTTVAKLQVVVGKMSESGVGSAYSRGMSWGTNYGMGSNRANGGGGGNSGGGNSGGGGGGRTPNGGGPTFGGNSAPGGGARVANGGGPTFSGNDATPGRHAAEVPTRFTGGGGGAHQADPDRLSTAGKAAFAYAATSGVYQNLTQSTGDSKQDSYSYNMVASHYSNGFGATGRNEKKLFNGGVNWATSGQDAAQAQADVMSMAGGAVGSRAQKDMTNAAAQVSFGNPALGAAASAQRATSFATIRSFVGLRTAGVNTIGKGGKRQSPTQIANQVLAQIDPSQSIRSENDAQALVNDQGSNLNMTLSNWVANGAVSGDQVETIKDAVLNILHARARGMSASRLNTLLNQKASGSSKQQAAAQKELDKVGVASSDVQKIRDQDAKKRAGTVDRLPDFDKGVRDATSAVSDFTDILNEVTKKFSPIQGRLRGITSQGPEGAVLTAGKWVVGAASSLTPSGIASRAVGGIGHAIGGLFGGGDNESRMSVNAIQGRSAGFGGGGSSGSAGFGGGGSGNPYNVMASRTGDSGAGGAITAAGGSGKGTPSGGPKKKGSGGQRMILPARGSIGVGFGVKGPMWHWKGYHTGQDIRCPTGTSVHAPADGTVIFAGWNASYGNLIEISHGHGVVSFMAHNSRLVKHVGASVRQGQLIAYSGATGNVSGPHCHFEVRVHGNPVNPMQFVTGGSRVSGQGGGKGSAGSGTNAPNGSGAQTTSSDGSDSGSSDLGIGGGGMAGGGTIGMSELDVLGAATGGGGGGFGGMDSSSGSDTGTTGTPGTPGAPGGGGGGGGGGAGGVGGSGPINSGGGSGAGAVYRALRSAGFNKVISAGIMGNMQAESGFSPTIVQGGGHASHPNTHAGYGLVQWTPGTKLKGYIGNHPATIANEIAALRSQLQGHGPSPEGAAGRALKGARTPEEAARIFGLKYERYAGGRQGGRESAARRFFHAYAKGAWDIPKDEVAQVHKNEMIIPAKEADQIRQILVNGNPYKAQGNQAKVSNGHSFNFAANAISITVTSTGNAAADGQAIGKAFLDTLQQNTRIDKLQMGVSG